MRRLPPLLLLALLAMAGFATPAFAHTELAQTSPADGATATLGGRAVTVTFTQPVDHRLATVTVRDSDGVVSTGTLQRDGLTLVQPVVALTSGRHDVRWRAAAADGHILEGTFSFRVRGSGVGDAAGDAAGEPETAEPQRLSPADQLREHAKGNYDHDATASYAAGAVEPAANKPDQVNPAPPAAAAASPAPAPDNSTGTILTLLVAALAVAALMVGVETLRASRV